MFFIRNTQNRKGGGFFCVTWERKRGRNIKDIYLEIKKILDHPVNAKKLAKERYNLLSLYFTKPDKAKWNKLLNHSSSLPNDNS